VGVCVGGGRGELDDPPGYGAGNKAWTAQQPVDSGGMSVTEKQPFQLWENAGVLQILGISALTNLKLKKMMPFSSHFGSFLTPPCALRTLDKKVQAKGLLQEWQTWVDPAQMSAMPALCMAAVRMTLQFLAQHTASGWLSRKASAAGSSYSMAHLACAARACVRRDSHQVQETPPAKPPRFVPELRSTPELHEKMQGFVNESSTTMLKHLSAITQEKNPGNCLS